MKHAVLIAVCLFAGGSAWAQFLDDFNGTSITKDPKALDGWAFFTGDGSATMDFRQFDGFASIRVDATKDQRNVWWALIKRRISQKVDLAQIKDFGMVRIVEILGGDPSWNQQSVTYNSLCGGQSIDRVLNSQMIIDMNVAEGRGGKTLATISSPVLQRMIDGKTLSLVIRPLGAITASFYALENQDGQLGPRLRFNLQE